MFLSSFSLTCCSQHSPPHSYCYLRSQDPCVVFYNRQLPISSLVVWILALSLLYNLYWLWVLATVHWLNRSSSTFFHQTTDSCVLWPPRPLICLKILRFAAPQAFQTIDLEEEQASGFSSSVAAPWNSFNSSLHHHMNFTSSTTMSWILNNFYCTSRPVSVVCSSLSFWKLSLQFFFMPEGKEFLMAIITCTTNTT